uniref:DNRLRE domain-containing protein n=1 Tax=Herbidospora sakaeratensis TaxID=564415 RepID=UPI0007811E11|nr:DNRLRE domain-containing protein [Herbidospora sakaeratensis]
MTPQKALDTPVGLALAQAKMDNRRVEIESMRSESATYYANPDGRTVRMEVHTEPVRVRTADGKGFTPIDTTLVAANGAIRPKAATGDLTLSSGQDRTLIKARAAGADVQISTPSTLPAPKLKGNTATYPDAYGQGRDLLVAATPTGFQQEIVIRQRPTAPVSFRVPLDLPEGLSLTEDTAGRPAIVGKDNRTVTTVRPTLMRDARAADSQGALDSGKVGRASVTLDDDGTTLVFTPDLTFLSDPLVTYPVTLTAAADDWYEGHTGDWVNGGMDTWINDVDYQDSWDTFTQDQIVVGKSYSSNIAKRWRGYLKFPDIPDSFAGSTVENADLNLWNYQSNACGTSVGSGITASRITSDWEETTLHWNTQPSVTNAGADTEFGAYGDDCTGSMAYAWDLTHSLNQIVQAWVDGATNYGIRLTAGNESDLRNWRRYRSDEAGGCRTTPLESCKGQLHPPILTVDFELPVQPVIKDFFFTSPDPITSFPSYEDAIARSIYEPGENEQITIGDELGGQISGQRQGDAYEVETDQLDIGTEGYEGGGEDTRAPQVVSTEPADGAVEVPLDMTLKVAFHEPVAGAEVILEDADGTEVEGTLGYDGTETEVTFTPAQALRPGTTYKAVVTGATDLWDNMMSPRTWSFTTVAQAAGQWTFDDGEGATAADTSGNDHHASLNDTAAWIAGKSGTAVSNTPSQARVAASRTASGQGKAVEVAAETTPTSITYAQPDGKTYTTEVTAGPVRARQGDVWVPIDPTLVERNGALAPKAVDSGFALTVANGGTGAFVSMTTADGQSYSLRWPTPLPRPTVEKNVATYPDAAGKGADLVVTVLPTGFRHDVVLRERPEKPLELRIGVDTGGLTLSEDKGGRLLLTSRTGKKKTVASAPQPVMWEAKNKAIAERADSVKIATEVVTKDGRTELVLKPDHAFLSDPETRYPVRVDPTTTLTLTNDVDVWSEDNLFVPADPSAPYLMAGRFDGQLGRVHLRFTTTGLAGANVTNAKLALTNFDSSGCGTTVGAGIQVRRLTSTWSQNNLLWGNKPATTTEDAQTSFTGKGEGCSAGTGPMEWTVTGIAQDWAAGAANHGLVLMHPNESSTTENYRVFSPTEDWFGYGPAPTLTVTTVTSAPVVSALTATPAQVVNGVTTLTSLTPSLSGTVTDVASANLTGQFEVEHDPAVTGQGTGQIWTGSSGTVTSGGQATVAIPAGNLVDGWRVRWRARAANVVAGTTSAWSAWLAATVDVPNPTVGAFQVTPSQLVNGVTTTTSVTPALHTTVTDPAAQQVRVDFVVEHDPAATGQGAGQIWAGNVGGVASGTQASLTVPAGTLTDGWRVRWRVRAVNTATTVASPWSDWQSLAVDEPDPVSEPAVTALQITPSEQVGDGIVTSSRAPSLLVQVNDPAGKPLRAEAEIEHDAVQVWTGGVDDAPAGTQAVIAVPAGTLTDGWQVRWRARAVSATAQSAWSDWQSFTVVVPKPTATALTITPSKVVDGATVLTMLTPTLRAVVTHPTGQPLRAEAEIEHDGAQIWTGGVDGVASGAQAAIPVPGGELTDGWTVRWRLRAVTDQAPSPWSDWQQATLDVTQPGEEPLAQTADPVIQTDQSFTAAAWLRWSDKDGDYSVAEQRGTHQAPFRLGNEAHHGLVFTFTSGDVADAAVEGVLSDVEAPVDEWFHLAGVYDAEAGAASLYLNGNLVKTSPVTFTPWHADTAMTLGTRMRGDLDEVEIYQRPLASAEVAALLPAPAAQDPPITPDTRRAAAAAPYIPAFKYRHPSLEDCLATASSGRFVDSYSRMQDRPYNACWTAWIGYTGWEEKDDGDGKDHKPASWSKLVPKQLKIPLALVNLLHPGDVFSFRATWVAHSYLANNTGREIYNGGDSTDGMKPQDMKFWLKLSDFGIYNTGIRRSELDDELDDVLIRIGLETSSECAITSGAPSQLKTIESWRSGYSPFTISTSQPTAPKDRATCSIMPAITAYEGKQGKLRLWDQEILGSKGERLGVVRWGHGVPPNNLNAPSFRCDWRQAGLFGEQHKGGCVNIRADRVFTMSKSKNKNFLPVINHIETALNQNENAGTFPPFRPGDTTDDRDDVKYPPIRGPLGNERKKIISGNYAKPSNTPEGYALWRGSDGNEKTNRKIFSSHSVYVPQEDFSIVGTTGNYCKYYFKHLYDDNADGAFQCDEYPFASTEQGAAKDRIHYSVRAVHTSYNQNHGDALQAFYGQYRVIPYDPERTPTKVSDNPFWVKIVD